MVTVTGMTRRTLMRNRVSPIVVTGSVVALVTVGLIGPDPGTAEWRQAEAHQRRKACREAGPLRYAYNRIDLS